MVVQNGGPESGESCDLEETQRVQCDSDVYCGEIPLSIRKLRTLQLENNIGEIPSWISNKTDLIFLDLSENDLEGVVSISKSIGPGIVEKQVFWGIARNQYYFNDDTHVLRKQVFRATFGPNSFMTTISVGNSQLSSLNCPLFKYLILGAIPLMDQSPMICRVLEVSESSTSPKTISKVKFLKAWEISQDD
ncbi:hypothetical protein F3Y22_tig00003973pilonHSYRG00038 [Hibiscus syriacus]|uniref:Uncharacterized protein n=1 Tax=Hibiscus syriacus TaxID=106335 RepID=A0A6A3CIY2_HIBSY|nr:hypothetical protein F3Y22_tig00003973pilonHSYRG00038 [Hibiscus syriacus]